MFDGDDLTLAIALISLSLVCRFYIGNPATGPCVRPWHHAQGSIPHFNQSVSRSVQNGEFLFFQEKDEEVAGLPAQLKLNRYEVQMDYNLTRVHAGNR